MKKIVLCLAAGLTVASVIVLARPPLPTPTPYPNCPANPTTSVDCSLTTAPDLQVNTSTAVEWVEVNKNPIVIKLPDPPTGSVPYPNLHAAKPYDWQSCAANGVVPLTQYSVTCTSMNNKKIYGHIIIRPIENEKKK